MKLDKAMIKAAAVALLDSQAAEHPLCHQGSKARRYILRVPGGTSLEVMFEQDPSSSANLWVHATAAGPLAVNGEHKPASALWSTFGKNGAALYGRHSALEKMPQLGAADLICFRPDNFEALGAILDQLIHFSAAGAAI